MLSTVAVVVFLIMPFLPWFKEANRKAAHVWAFDTHGSGRA